MKIGLFLFSLKLKTSFFGLLGSFFTNSRGLNLSVVNYQNPRKAQEKIKPTICYGHYVTDIILQTSHYRHYIMDIMTA